MASPTTSGIPASPTFVLSPNPAGPPPGALSHDDRGPMLVGVAWFLVVAPALVMGLRLYCKMIGSRRLWWDDYILIASWVRRMAGPQALERGRS